MLLLELFSTPQPYKEETEGSPDHMQLHNFTFDVDYDDTNTKSETKYGKWTLTFVFTARKMPASKALTYHSYRNAIADNLKFLYGEEYYKELHSSGYSTEYKVIDMSFKISEMKKDGDPDPFLDNEFMDKLENEYELGNWNDKSVPLKVLSTVFHIIQHKVLNHITVETDDGKKESSYNVDDDVGVIYFSADDAEQSRVSMYTRKFRALHVDGFKSSQITQTTATYFVLARKRLRNKTYIKK